jgi:glycosyltransferase involved in cell wall biosynthesis
VHFATAVSAASQRSFIAAHGWPAEKVKVVHVGLDVPCFRQAGAVGVTDPELLELRSEAAPLLGTVANMSQDKDYGTLLQGFRSLLEVLPAARLLVIGGGPQFAETSARIKAMGLSGTTRLLGFRRDVPAVLPLLDVFVLSSRTEGFGLSLLEAMASRVPVVASAAEGILEIVEDGKCGLTFDPGDAEGMVRCVLRLWGDCALRERLADAAYGRVLTRFSLANAAGAFCGLYRSSLT